MASKPITINKSTGITIGLVITIVTVVWGAAMAYAQIQNNTDKIDDAFELITSLTTKLDSYNDNLNTTNDNVIRLSTQLEERNK